MKRIVVYPDLAAATAARDRVSAALGYPRPPGTPRDNGLHVPAAQCWTRWHAPVLEHPVDKRGALVVVDATDRAQLAAPEKSTETDLTPDWTADAAPVAVADDAAASK